MGGSILENIDNLGEIEELEIAPLVCGFLDRALESRAAEQREFIRRLTTCGGRPVDVLHVVFEIRKHIVAEGGAGEF